MKARVVSSLVAVFLLLSPIAAVIDTKAVSMSGTIYIRADGSIDPPTAPIHTADNITYTLTGNIIADADGIVIERDNIMVNGAGYTVTGSGSGTGTTLTNRSNVTLGNMTIKNFYNGIWLEFSSDSTLSGNDVTANYYLDGIVLNYSSHNNIANNAVSGTVLNHCSNNALSGNNIANNIFINSSSNNALSGNNITGNSQYGIWLRYSSNNALSGNNITGNSQYGIRLYYSSNNALSGNNIANHIDGIWLDSSSNNTLSGNDVTANNNSGIYLQSSFNNFIFHNNFVGNTNQLGISGPSAETSNNTLDDGYPSGGNYWSDYTWYDQYSGPYQNESGGDGIWDYPYVIWAGNPATDATRDHYPLVNPWVSGTYVPVTVYIRGNGSVVPSSAPISSLDNVTYTFTGNISYPTCYGIVVERSNIVVDGNGYTLQGPTSERATIGISVNSKNVTIRNMSITSFQWADIVLYPSSTSWNTFYGNDAVYGNNIIGSQYGVVIWASQNSTVYGNNISGNSCAGILFRYSSYNTVIGNNIATNSIGILLSSNGGSVGSSNNTIYHNSFVNNGEQVSTQRSPLPSSAPLNVWDDGYPSGGNYWGDYHGVDLKKGQDQDMPGSDGIGDTSYVIDENNTDYYPLILNPLVPAHDIAIDNVMSSKTVIGRGFSGNVSVYVGNDGASAETFNVTAYAKMTAIGTQQVNNLSATGQMTLTFTWNTTGLAFGNYTISAYAWPVPGETDTSDNDRATAVNVSVPGDINSDGRVDMKDIGEAARAFNTVAGAAKWDANADINNDGKIDMKDISTVARHFGEHI